MRKVPIDSNYCYLSRFKFNLGVMNDCNLLNADFAPANLCGAGSCDWGNMKLDHVYFTCGTAQNVQEQCCADERNPDEVIIFDI